MHYKNTALIFLVSIALCGLVNGMEIENDELLNAIPAIIVDPALVNPLNESNMQKKSVYIARKVGANGYVCKQFFCRRDGCSYSTGKEHIINNHMKLHVLIDEGSTDIIPCKKCDFLAFNKGVMRRHNVTHESVRPYVCPQCNKSFKVEFCCDRHIEQQHYSKKPRKPRENKQRAIA